VASKFLVTGTGRSGTSLVMQLLTACGADTGYAGPFKTWYMPNMGGMDRDLHTKMTPEEVAELPSVVKDPRACRRLPHLLANGIYKPDHVIVCVRDIREATLSFMSANNIWYPDDPDDPDSFRMGSVEGVGLQNPYTHISDWLRQVLGSLLETLVVHDIPFTTVAFPRFVSEPDYLERRLYESGVFDADDGLSYFCPVQTFRKTFSVYANTDNVNLWTDEK